MASLVPPLRSCAPTNGPAHEVRSAAFGHDAAQMDDPQPMARLINWALSDLMLEHSEIVVMGQDVGAKGGVYGVTQKLITRFGRDRVIDTLLDEQSIFGPWYRPRTQRFHPDPRDPVSGLSAQRPRPDQGEAATLPFFSNGQFTNPMVLRIAGLGYQRGFGGHFHNDNSIAFCATFPV